MQCELEGVHSSGQGPLSEVESTRVLSLRHGCAEEDPGTYSIMPDLKSPQTVVFIAKMPTVFGKNQTIDISWTVVTDSVVTLLGVRNSSVNGYPKIKDNMRSVLIMKQEKVH